MGAICGGICNGNFSVLVCNGRIRLLVSGRRFELQIRAWTGLPDLHRIVFSCLQGRLEEHGIHSEEERECLTC